MKNSVRILFVGNSHTYYNDMPKMVKEFFAASGVRAEVVMQTEAGKGLLYHCERKDVIFNIKYGDFDYVVLQDIAKLFDRPNFLEGAEKIMRNAVEQSDAKPVFYMIWAHRDNKKLQSDITEAYAYVARKYDALLAPAGEVWHRMLRGNRNLAFYREDGNHATPLGSYLAASAIFYALSLRERPLRITDGDEPHTSLGLDTALCRRIHSETCRTAKKYNIEKNFPL